jgi:Beta-propeller repeat
MKFRVNGVSKSARKNTGVLGTMTIICNHKNPTKDSMVASERLAGVMLGLAGLISFFALQVPPSPLTALTHGRQAYPDLSSAATAASNPGSQSRANELCGKLPLSFEANCGQSYPQVKFISRGAGYTLFLGATEVLLGLQSEHATCPNPETAILRMKLVGGNSNPQSMGLGELPGKCNYFIGNNPKLWSTDVPTYLRVKYKDVYPGVNMIYRGHQRQLEFDFIVAPGVDPKVIRLAFKEAQNFYISPIGELVLQTSVGEIRLHKPLVYQQKGEIKQEIVGRYVIREKDQVGFELGPYDRNKAVVIDPVLSYSSYLGGSGDDLANGITVDSAGNIYVTGRSSSPNFPTTAGAFQPAGIGDAFVTKLNPTSGALVYSTYLGGGSLDEGFGIAVDAAGNAYVTGSTSSDNFPTTVGSFQTAKAGGSSAFVAKLNSTGNALTYSTYLGGSDSFVHQGGGQNVSNAISVDSIGNAYITGSTDSNNFPTLNALQPTYNGGICGSDALFPCLVAFVTKLNSAGTSLVFSTYLGGSSTNGRGGNVGRGIAVDFEGNVYVVGSTGSTTFPTANAVQAVLAGSSDVFVVKLNPSGNAFVYSTYLGGSKDDVGNSIAVDPSSNAYITGSTMSTDFPRANPLQPNKGDCNPGVFTAACNDAFVAKLNSAGSALAYSTYLGGNNGDVGNSIAVDAAGNAYVTGQTFSRDFPTKNALQSSKRGDSSVSDAFITKLNAAGSALFYSTYLGGKGNESGSAIAVDFFGNAYVTGSTSSTNFPTVNPVQADYRGGSFDAFVVKISAPRIISASVSGKRLFVSGEGFDDGAVIIINGEEQKTRNDEQQMTTLLIGKKAGNRIAPGQTVILQVRASDGTLSREFPFTRPVE